MLNALTIDVEEHFQVHNFATVIDRDDWDRFPSRVDRNVRRILDLLAEHDTKATFFVLGWVAERNPKLVQAIAQAGHEIATHGCRHELVYDQGPEAFANDVQRSVEVIQDALVRLTGDRVHKPIGYRAPAFSITRQCLWALDVLSDLGLQYDSSIFPLVAHDRYGISDADRFANRIKGKLWEFPVSTVRLGGRNWPVCGGGYFRLLPLWVTQSAMRRIQAEGQPVVVYLHPWELDPQQPLVAGAPLLSRFRHYVNLAKTEARLRALLKAFSFAPMRQVFADCLGSAP